MKDRILKLLGNGVSPALVSIALGCTESYISQLLSDPDFAFEVAKIRCKDLEDLKARDDKYDDLEDKLLDKLEAILPYLTRPRDIISALKEINAAKRRSVDLLGGGSAATTQITNIVVLSLPTRTTTAFQLNKNNEVVAIGDQSLAAMPTAALLSSLKELEREKTVQGERIQEGVLTHDLSAQEARTTQKALGSTKILDENSV